MELTNACICKLKPKITLFLTNSTKKKKWRLFNLFVCFNSKMRAILKQCVYTTAMINTLSNTVDDKCSTKHYFSSQHIQR